jgi:hypothetical protein
MLMLTQRWVNFLDNEGVGQKERVGRGGGCCLGGLDRLGPLSKTELLIAAREMPPQPVAARRRQLCTDAYVCPLH